MNAIHKFVFCMGNTASLIVTPLLAETPLVEPYASTELLPEYPFGYYSNASQIEELFQQHDVRIVIEVGSWIGGGSTRHIGNLLKAKGGLLYAVDTWLGSSTQQPNQAHYQPILPQVYQQFLSNMIHWDLTQTVVPIWKDSLIAAQTLKIQPDLVYIDAEHTTPAVYADLCAWYPFVEHGGILCGDDWSWESVRDAVKLFAHEKRKQINASGNFWYLSEYARTDREQHLIQHVQQSIANAEQGISFLSEEALSLEGMSSRKVRHLLNNLCSLPVTNYLEIGCWKGSTLISSLFGNNATVASAVAIDNWSEFGRPKEEFYENCSKFLPLNPYHFHEIDCFKVEAKSLCSNPINVYFYDGEHTELTQELAFTYYNSVFDKVFIAVVDDWNWGAVRTGTRRAFKNLEYQVLFEVVLPSRWNLDTENWWNGLYVAVIRKP